MSDQQGRPFDKATLEWFSKIGPKAVSNIASAAIYVPRCITTGRAFLKSLNKYDLSKIATSGISKKKRTLLAEMYEAFRLPEAINNRDYSNAEIKTMTKGSGFTVAEYRDLIKRYPITPAETRALSRFAKRVRECKEKLTYLKLPRKI